MIAQLPPVKRITDQVLGDFGIPREMLSYIDYPSDYDSPRRAARARGHRHLGPGARGLRRPAVGLLGAQPRPRPVQGPQPARRDRGQGGRDHRRLERHRRGARAARRRGRRRSWCWSRARRTSWRRSKAEIEEAGGVAHVHPGRPVRPRGLRPPGRGDPRRARPRRHPRQQRRALDPALDRELVRPLPRLPAHDAAELLRRAEADPRVPARDARPQVRPHHQRLLDRRADQHAALLGLRREQERARRVLALDRVGDRRRRRAHHDRLHAARAHADDRADRDLRRVPDRHARRGRGHDHAGDDLPAEEDRDAPRHLRRGALRDRAEVRGRDPQHGVQAVPRERGRARREEEGRSRSRPRASRSRT